jgi:AraC family transcriptional regulator of adaptative response/methylated-DNA-[protein]-cysteine methyltransferase
LIGDTPAQLKGRELLKADWLETPIGSMLAVADQHHLHLLEFFERKGLPNELKKLRQYTKSSISFGRLPPIDQIESELKLYFTNGFTGFKTPLALYAPAFTRSVWDALQEIPLGQTCSYAELAERTGRPDAIRAVANANGANQLSIIIPCHRTIGTDGALTGYGGGLWRKRWLLEHEKRMAAQSAA